MTATSSRLAVFIDCENANPNLAPAFFSRRPELAKANIKRAYGDAERLQGWSEILRKYCFQSQLTPAIAKKDNATDFALVIDCLELLHARRFDEAWLVTSDADFTQLAMHIRSHGVRVYCVGDERALAPLSSACDEFVNYAPTRAETPCNSSTTSPALVTRLLTLFKELTLQNPDGVYLATFGQHFKERPFSGKLGKFLISTGAFSIDNQMLRRAASYRNGPS